MIAKCNGQGPLLVILQTDKGQVLGGYYPIRFQIPDDKGAGWASNVAVSNAYAPTIFVVTTLVGGWRRASKAFLFCIDPKFGWRTFPVKAPRADKVALPRTIHTHIHAHIHTHANMSAKAQ